MFAAPDSFTATPDGWTEPDRVRVNGSDYIREATGATTVNAAYIRLPIVPVPADPIAVLDQAIDALSDGRASAFSVTVNGPADVTVLWVDVGATFEYTLLSEAPEIAAPLNVIDTVPPGETVVSVID